MSIGQICDDGCKAIFDKDKLEIFNSTNTKVITGKRNPSDGLYDIPLKTAIPQSFNGPEKHQANVVVQMNKTKMELAKFHHGSCFSPVASQFMEKIQNGNFLTWPGLTKKLIQNMPTTRATVMGHIKQEFKNLRSTKTPIKMETIVEETIPDIPTEPATTGRTHDCFVTICTKEEGTTYSDLCGRYPVKSSRGNQYILVCYDYDTKAILAEPIQTRAAANISNALNKMLDVLEKAGSKPNIHIMDNEASAFLKHALLKRKIKYQLVPPHIHRQNLAERAIQTFKAHFIAGLCTTDPEFPAAEWDRLLPQAIITLNHLRNSRLNPRLSSHAALFGMYDFNTCPLAPPGTKVIVHEKHDNRATWSPRGTDGWYIGPSLEHYRCVKCFMPETHSVRDADTVTFMPTVIPFPKTTTEDYLRQSVGDILSLLKHQKSQLPFLNYGDDTTNAIQQIATLLNRAIPPPVPVIPNLPVPTPAPMPTPTPVISPTIPLPSPEDPIQPNQRPPPAVLPPPSKANKSIHAYGPAYGARVPRVDLERVKEIFKRLQQQPAQRLHAPRHSHYTRGRSRYAQAAAQLAQDQEYYNPAQVNHMYHPVTGMRENYDQLKKREPDRWNRSMANEMGRLAQGVGTRMKSGTDTTYFIKRNQVPKGKKVTYANAICDYRPLKDDPYRVRLTVGGDRLEYAGDASAPAASLLDSKLIFNSTISTPGAKFLTTDIKDYFLNNPMEEFEYMKIPLRWFPQEIIEQYDIMNIVEDDGFVYVEIRKGMYGLKQAARIAFDRLVKLLEPDGYYPLRCNPGMWRHKTRDILFTLCVDDFGIKYSSLADANHLLNTLQKHYKISTDWTGTQYCGLTLDWNYLMRYVDVSMPGYVPKALHKFQHPNPKKPQYAPHEWTEPAYGQRIQYASPEDNLPLLDKLGIIRVQSINGTFLYYARAVDPTMLVALNEISQQQSKPTAATLKKCDRLMDYAATYPNAVIRYHASDMILHVDTDAAYLVLPKAKSRVAGHYYLSNHPPTTGKPTPIPNGPIHTVCQTLKNVVSSAAESEMGGLFVNGQYIIPVRTTLVAMGHPQPKNGTPLKTDSATSLGIVKNFMQPKRSKSWDMRYHWIQDRDKLGDLNPYWEKGTHNWADYFTKHHSPAHHKIMRYKYLQKMNSLSAPFSRRDISQQVLALKTCCNLLSV
jgi:hypothetical protein